MNGICVRDFSITSGRDGGQTKLVDSVSLTVEPGEVYCLLGQERGKKLLLRLVGGGHDGCTVYIDSENVVADVPIMEDVCYVLTGESLWDWMTVYEYAKYMLSYFVMGGKELDELAHALKLVGLDKHCSVKLRYLTATQKKLLEIALHLSRGRTKIIVNADDLIYTPRQFKELETALVGLKASGKTVLLALKDARMVCPAVTTVGVFKNGRIVISGDPRSVSHLLKRTCYSIRPTGNIKAIADSIKALAASYEVRIHGDKLLVYTNSDRLPKDIVQVLSSNGEGISLLRKTTPSLSQGLKKIL